MRARKLRRRTPLGACRLVDLALSAEAGPEPSSSTRAGERVVAVPPLRWCRRRRHLTQPPTSSAATAAAAGERRLLAAADEIAQRVLLVARDAYGARVTARVGSRGALRVRIASMCSRIARQDVVVGDIDADLVAAGVTAQPARAGSMPDRRHRLIARESNRFRVLSTGPGRPPSASSDASSTDRVLAPLLVRDLDRVRLLADLAFLVELAGARSRERAIALVMAQRHIQSVIRGRSRLTLSASLAAVSRRSSSSFGSTLDLQSEV